MKKSNPSLVRNVTVPLTKTQKSGLQSKNRIFDSDNGFCTVIQPHTTLKMLQEIENLKRQDLDLDSDEDIPCGAPSFGANERLYSNLISLDVNIPCPAKLQPKTVRQPLRKDPVPDEKEFMTETLQPQPVYHGFIVPEFPEKFCTVDDHSLYKRIKSWKNPLS